MVKQREVSVEQVRKHVDGFCYETKQEAGDNLRTLKMGVHYILTTTVSVYSDGLIKFHSFHMSAGENESGEMFPVVEILKPTFQATSEEVAIFFAGEEHEPFDPEDDDG